MKTAGTLIRRGDQGYALIIVMVFVGLALIVLASVMNFGKSTAMQADRNNLFTVSSAASEGATELVLAQMANDFYNQALQSTNSYMTNSLLPNATNWPVKFSFGNPNNTSAVTYVTMYPLNWTTNWAALFSTNAAGLHAFIANCSATSTATVTNQLYNVSAGVQLQFQLAAIPVFQYAIFYNLNMEIDPGAAMTVNGPVFSNGGIWAGSPFLTFAGPVAAVGIIATNATDPFSTGYTGGGGPTFQNGLSPNSPSVALPIGTTNDPNALRSLLSLPTNGITPNSSTGAMYFVNQADIIISNSASGVIAAYFQDSNNVSRLTSIPYDSTQIILNLLTLTLTTNASYSFATNASFYDYREGKTVQAVQFDVGAFNAWLGGLSGSVYNAQLHADAAHYIDSVYVYNGATASNTTLPAVRVADGAALPSHGLTVITPDPLYVMGNYNATGSSLNNGTNVANTVPAALIADAITILSANWNDHSYTNGYALSSRTPTNTTINAAAYEGIVPTNGTNYSGGVENFIRLLENWGASSPLTYNGSIVVMFPSKYATNYWKPVGNYYNPPKRNWAFDLNFQTQNGLPPLTPELRAVFRQGWASY